MTEKEHGVPVTATVEGGHIYMDVDTSNLDLPRALEVIAFLKGRIVNMDTTIVQLQSAVAEREARVKRLMKDHADDFERTFQKMERKIEARDHTIEALQQAVVRVATIKGS